MSTPRCAMCGRPDVFGLGLCAECNVSDPNAGSLVFVRRSTRKHDREATRDRLSELLGERAETADGRAAVRGERALLRVPAELAEHAVTALEQRGVPARTLSVRRAWTAMPSHFVLLVCLICITGYFAGGTVAPLLLISPLLALTLIVAAQHSASRPLLRPPSSESLSTETETALRNAFARARGRPRELLGDLVRIIRPLAATLQREGDPAAVAGSLSELLVAASATALEVSRLEVTYAAVQDVLSSGSPTESSPALSAAGQRCADAAATGTRRLVEAVRAVADIGNRTAVDSATGSHLSRLTHELTVHARIREGALRDVDSLLAR